MIGSSIINIAIGLFVVYFLMSSIASVVSEMIGMFLQRRANNMAQFIVDMLGEKNDAHPSSDTFYASSIFYMNEIGGFVGIIARIGHVIFNLPFFKNPTWIPESIRRLSWVPRWVRDGSPNVAQSAQVLSMSSANFAQAVFEMLKTAAESAQDLTPKDGEPAPNLGSVVKDVEKTAANAQVVLKTSDDVIRDLLAALDALGIDKKTPLRAAIETAIQQADGKVEKITANLERWFNGQMVQLSDLYKRKTRFYLFIIGAVLAFALNVDSIAIFQALQNSPDLQNTLLGQAQSIINNGAPSIPVVPTPEPTPEATPSVEELSQRFTTLNNQFQTLQGQLIQTGLPIGWETNTPTLTAIDWTSTVGLSKIIGLIITSTAIALGAQFWFDLLKALAGRPSAAATASGAAAG